MLKVELIEEIPPVFRCQHRYPAGDGFPRGTKTFNERNQFRVELSSEFLFALCMKRDCPPRCIDPRQRHLRLPEAAALVDRNLEADYHVSVNFWVLGNKGFFRFLNGKEG